MEPIDVLKTTFKIVFAIINPSACADGPPEDSQPYETGEETVIPSVDAKCPDGSFRTRDGCEPLNLPDNDRDGDGVSNYLDRCPDEYHLTSDGCPAPAEPAGPVIPNYGFDDEGVTQDTEPPENEPPPESVASPELQSLGEFMVTREEMPICPHMDMDENGTGIIAWQEGTDIVTASFSTSEGINANEAQTIGSGPGDSNVTLCNVKKAAALTGPGDIFVIPELRDGNVVYLSLKPAAGEGPVEVTRFFMPRLGIRKNYYFASMDAFPNGNAVVVWADRDKIAGTIIASDGSVVLDKFTINRRALEVLNVINPDVSIVGPDKFAVTWQEGDGETGPIMGTVFDTAGNKLTEDTLISDVNGVTNGKWPSLSGNESSNATAWVGNNNMGYAGVRSSLLDDPGALFVFGSSEERPDDVMAPEISFDRSSRMAIAWMSGSDGQNSQVNLAWIGSPEAILPDAVDSGMAVGETAVNSRIAIKESGNYVTVAYPAAYPVNVMKLSVFGWSR